MTVITSVRRMQAYADSAHGKGRRIALVPTMGFLHEGHFRLLQVGRTKGDVLVMSIFVNPTQFGPKEDFARYPRDMRRDLAYARRARVDAVFAPSAAEMYSAGFQTYVEVGEVTRTLCGPFRPGHFRGVATVVAKLFHIVRPHVALFGEKDYQQLVVIRRMVRDLNMGIEIVGVPTVREPDGLAMSSRNTYLSGREREAALCLSRSLRRARDMVRSGTRTSRPILREVRRVIAAEPLARMEYASLVDPETLGDVAAVGRRALLALAVRVGRTRLIDNTLLP